jgi:hypothetical protein
MFRSHLTSLGLQHEARSNDVGSGPQWPPVQRQRITFQTKEGVKEGIVKEAWLGLVWRDFLLEDGRMVAEHKVIGCPDPSVWRDPDSVSADERKAWEERLISMAESGMDPRDREKAFWADLTQYIAYTYLRFSKHRDRDEDAA